MNEDWTYPYDEIVDVNNIAVVVPCPDLEIFLGEELDTEGLMNWLMSLTNNQVDAGKMFFRDRWNWDTGAELDLLFAELFENESERRRLMTMSLDEVFVNIFGKDDVPEYPK